MADCGNEICPLAHAFIPVFQSLAADLPPLNGTTSRAIIWWCQNQRRAFHATRKERTGRADHPQAASVEVEVGRGKTVAESVKKIGVTEQTYYRWKKQYGGLRIDQAKRLKDLEKENSRLKRLLADAELDKAILREAALG